jgi:chorismate mutase / prephenate dehydratase
VTLLELRTKIDAIDEQIVRLLNERASIAVKIGELKKETGQPIFCAEREKQVFAKVTNPELGTVLPPENIEAIYKAIIASAHAVEQRVQETPR